MKVIGGATLVGLVLALAMIYWLQPLNTGAMTLILLLCLSAANSVASLLSSPRKRKKS